MRINFNANKEYDSYLSSESTVLNTESFEASTSDTELSKASSSEDSNEKFFERTKIAEKARYTFQLPLSSTFTIMGSLFGYFTRSLMVKYYGHGFLETWFKQTRKLHFIKRKKCLTKLNLEKHWWYTLKIQFLIYELRSSIF